MVGVCPDDENGAFVLLALGYTHLMAPVFQSVRNQPQGEVWPLANYVG